ncbi:hypothetical protein LTR97_011272 [Elasticomyces elasticus]|uniref:Uncharacterized protein n=1 Tax=Elasticomyces elasticus TaxID=574655 RepID=A0AAN7ZYU1_9PEZI|nr:hypothetical protein LTR97_011272 [Elasticomyces elasticus]
MANRKDMRREDLIVPYTEPEEKKDASSDIQGTMASTLPMAAIFTRNKMIGWTSVIFAVQGWLSETAASKSSQATPAIFSVGMAFLSLGVAYMPLFMPPTPGPRSAAGTPAQAAMPAPA